MASSKPNKSHPRKREGTLSEIGAGYALPAAFGLRATIPPSHALPSGKTLRNGNGKIFVRGLLVLRG